MSGIASLLRPGANGEMIAGQRAAEARETMPIIRYFLVIVGFAYATGCTLIADVDRGKIDSTTGGRSNAGGRSGSGGGTTGGSGGTAGSPMMDAAPDAQNPGDAAPGDATPEASSDGAVVNDAASDAPAD